MLLPLHLIRLGPLAAGFVFGCGLRILHDQVEAGNASRPALLLWLHLSLAAWLAV